MKRYFAVCGTFARCVLPYFLIVLLGLLGFQGWCFYQAAAHPPILEDPAMNEVVRSLTYILSRSIHLKLVPAVLAAVLLFRTSSKNTRLTDTLDRLPIHKNSVLACQAICFTLCFLTTHFALTAFITVLSSSYTAVSLGTYTGPQSVVQEFFANSFLRNFIPIFEPWKHAANFTVNCILGTTLACNSECMRRGKTPVSGLFAFLILAIFYSKTDEGFGLGLVGMILVQLYAFVEVGTARDAE